MDTLRIFCRQVRSRSADHREAVLALRGLPSQIVSVLRQELDSLVRVVYLLSQVDQDYREQLLADAVSGRRWTRQGSRKTISDREMVELTNRLHGWTRSVYSFGCAFIHLSQFHDHHERDPLSLIAAAEQEAILTHLRRYHGGPKGDTPTFADVVPFLPAVFEKIAGNLECYVAELESVGQR